MKRLGAILYRGLLLWLGGVMLSPLAFAEITVLDDAGNELTLRAPARRVISLAPHVTELLYAAGAGNYVVGAVEYSDYPEQAKRIPRVGGGSGLDIEKIVGLHPDLIISWQSGNPSWQTERIKQLGFPVFVTEPRHVGDVASLIERFGRLTATEAHAREMVGLFVRDQKNLRDRYAKRSPVTVFYQILDSSLLTISQRHLISDVIQLCGGGNVFADLPGLTSRVDVESVLQKNPEVILASGYEPLWPAWDERWRSWPTLSASARGNLFFIPPDLIHRHSPRILQGAEQVCAALEKAREARKISKAR
ncbi:MAG TPA: cobalamin-binding protein [Gammaproteobacteria bacterium]|nr:cobalamin-binding protein [Gammaproteobacteria bacterium]